MAIRPQPHPNSASTAWSWGRGPEEVSAPIPLQGKLHQLSPGKGRQRCPSFPNLDCHTPEGVDQWRPATFNTPPSELPMPHKSEAARGGMGWGWGKQPLALALTRAGACARNYRRRKGAGQARGGVVRSGFELLTHQLGGARQGGAGVEASPAAWRKVVVGAGRTM